MTLFLSRQRPTEKIGRVKVKSIEIFLIFVPSLFTWATVC